MGLSGRLGGDDKSRHAGAGAGSVKGRFRGRSSVWLEHSTVTREVAGSSPVAPVGSMGSLDRLLAVRRIGISPSTPDTMEEILALVVKLVDTPS